MTKPKAPLWMPLYVAEHSADTARLSVAELGSLLRLMCSYWHTGPIPDHNDVLARIVGVSPSAWSGLRPTVEQFFDVKAGVWTHPGLDVELEKAYDAIQRNAKRTEAATRARLTKQRTERSARRDAKRDVGRDVERDESCDEAHESDWAQNAAVLDPVPSPGSARNVARDVPRYVVPTTSIGGRPPRPLARAKADDDCPSVGLEDEWGALTLDNEREVE